MKIIHIFILYLLFYIQVDTKLMKKHKRNIHDQEHFEERNLPKLNYRVAKDDSKETSKMVKFVTGVGVGFGLGVDATEELKNCFLKKENHNSIINKFMEKSNSFNKQEFKEENKMVKESTKSFTTEVINLFSNFKDCAPFQETFFTFIKMRILNLGIKGIAFAAGGIIGLLIKGSYDLIKLLKEINNFYKVRSHHPVDYYNLGSSVGKIIYYTQNLIVKKRR